MAAYDPISALAANARFARLEDANRYADAPRAAGGPARPPVRLYAPPRVLADDGAAARDAWEIAAGGIGNATAYHAPSLGGWHWVAVLGAQDLGHGGAVLLVIQPDGTRWAERYGDEAEAWRDMEFIAAEADDDRAAATPSEFAAILDPMAEPVAVAAIMAEFEPVAVADPGPVAVEPEPVAVVEPMAVEPVARGGIWRRFRGWVVRQLDAMLDPWAGGAWRDNLPVIVAASEFEPDGESEPVAAPFQPGRARGWVAGQLAAMASPWPGRGFRWNEPRPSATATG